MKEPRFESPVFLHGPSLSSRILHGCSWLALAAGALTLSAQEPPLPTVSVWYRGTPPGTPKLDDLIGLAAAGFTSVTWPATSIGAVPALNKLALDAGLAVDVVATPRPLTPATSAPAQRADIVVAALDQEMLPALIWRAVARGARTIAFDGGVVAGTGITGANGDTPPWVWTAIAIARTFRGNGTLISRASLYADQPVTISGGAKGLDVKLLDTPRAWIAIATNLDRAPVRAMIRFPARVPYAMWVSLIDGEPTAMFDEPAGPRWDLRLGPGQARVIVIDHQSRSLQGEE